MGAAVFEGETGFLLVVRSRYGPCVTWPLSAANASVPSGRTKLLPGASDLAVEVVSPGDTVTKVDDKVRTWLEGRRMVWVVVDPKWRSVTVYRSPSRVNVRTEGEDLSGEEVVEGFRCTVGDIFAA